jgi:RimJ/RimL family protein N-acetyltransferase
VQDLSFVKINSEKLVLRRFEARDAQALSSYRNDPAVARYQSWESCSVEEARRFVESLEELVPGTPGQWFQFAVSRTPSGALIGDCALRCTEHDPRQAELGFTMAPAHQGQGLASEAVRSLVTYAFSTLDVHRVFAIVDIRNVPAQRLLERLKFRQEGHFVENAWFKGSWSSEFLYAILRAEWQQKVEGEGGL